MRPKVYERDDVRLEVRGRRGSIPSSVKVTARLPVEGWRVRWRLDPVTLRPVGDPTYLYGAKSEEPNTYVEPQGRYERFMERVEDRVEDARADGFPDLPVKTRSRRGGAGIDVAQAVKLREQKLSSTKIAEQLDCHPGAVRTALRRAGQVQPRDQYLAQFPPREETPVKVVPKPRPKPTYANRSPRYWQELG